MSAPLVVNTTDGTCWTRRGSFRNGEALYAPEGVCSCPEFVMATLTELAEHGIVGSADALPVPVGPELSPFPPAPRNHEEKLEGEVARLQGLLAEKTAEVHRACRERDRIRERVSEPYGCTHCGEAKRSHGRQYLSGVGMHVWERPSDAQVKDRMLARRAARMPLVADGITRRIAPVQALREDETTPEFFQPGRTYAREHHAATIRFLVRYVDDCPDGFGRVAFGWKVEDGDVTWSPFDSDDFTSWAMVSEGGDA